MRKKRNYKRYEIDGYGELLAYSMNKVETFRVLDMSASGVRIVFDQPLDIDGEVTLKIEFSKHLLHNVIQVKGRVIRKTTNEQGVEYAIGFADLTHETRVEIDEALRHEFTVEITRIPGGEHEYEYRDMLDKVHH